MEHTAFVTCPSVFSPTKWVRRRLTSRELLNVLDVPDSIITLLPERIQSRLVQDMTIMTLKVVLHLFNLLPIDSLTQPAENPCKRPKVMPATVAYQDPMESVKAHFPSTPDSVPAVSSQQCLEQEESTRNQKANKSDDAPVPEYLWDRSIASDQDPSRAAKIAALTPLRQFALRWWKRHLTRDFLNWFHTMHRLNLTSFAAKRDKEAGCELITRAANSTWSEWKDGSRPFFWRWPYHYQAQIRDDIHLWCHGTLPKWRVPQRHEPDPDLRERMRLKLLKVRLLRYIIPGLFQH